MANNAYFGQIKINFKLLQSEIAFYSYFHFASSERTLNDEITANH